MNEESINNVTEAVENSTICKTEANMKSEPIDDIDIGDPSAPGIRLDPTMVVNDVLMPMLCDTCGFKTDDKSVFEDHVRTHVSGEHAEQAQMLLVCSLCNFTGRNQSDLLNHVKTHIKSETPNDPGQGHTTSITLSNEPFQVLEYRINDGLSESSQTGETANEDVDMAFSKDAAGLVRLKVSGEYSLVSGPSKTQSSSGSNPVPTKRFTCDVCGYKTNKKVTFEDHLRTHTGEKPFACDQCDYRSSSKHTLGKHKKIHTRPKPFKCDSCEYRGSTRSDLTRHMNTHTKSYSLHNGDFVPEEHLQIGTPVMLPVNPSEPTPQTVYTIFSYDNNLTNVQSSTGPSDTPSAESELVLLNSAALDGFQETPSMLQPADDVMLGSRNDSLNERPGNPNQDRLPNDPLQVESSEEISQDDTSNSSEPIQTGNSRFSCDHCNYSNNRRHDFEVHLRTHTGETPFACTLCDKKYIARKTLNRHMKSRHGAQQFGCVLCNFRAAQKSDVDEHVRSHHNTDGNANEPLGTEFEAQYEPANDRLMPEQIGEHREKSSPSWAYEVIDTGNQHFTCEECGYETQQKSNFESHIMTHSRVEVFACELCDKTFTTSSTLDRHLREDHGETLFDCNLCEYRALNESDLTEHVRTHVKTEVESATSEANIAKFGLEMDLSNYSGPSESSQPGNDSIKTEYETYEPTNDPLQLNLSEEHSQDSSLSRHSDAEMIGNRNKRFKCDVCGYKTSRKYEFTVHTRTHTGEKPYGCSLCDYRSIKKSYVNKHMKTHLKTTGDSVVLVNTDSNYRPQVKSNPVLLSDSAELKEASGNSVLPESSPTVRILSVDEHFTCERCDYKCDDLTAWSQHMFEHTREKTFSCSECDYRTKDVGRFNLHIEGHNVKVKEVPDRATPFSSVTITCEFCDYPFTTRADMCAHLVTSHPEKCPHSCDLCDFKAFSARSLELHKETHAVNHVKVEPSLLSRVASAPAEEYVCYSCDFKASNVEEVELHISTTHNLSTAETTSLSVITEVPSTDGSVPLQPDVQEYLCYACDYKAREIVQVEEHILRSHSAPVTHEIAVPLASLTSESPGNYLPNSASNVGVEEYVCYACDFKACSVAQVQQHIQITHPLTSESNSSPMGVTSEASSSVSPL